MVAQSDRRFFAVNALISISALALLSWLLLFRKNESGKTDLHFVPALNAFFNFTSATLLVLGRVAVVRKKISLHRSLMLLAFLSSTLFLIGYLVYHSMHSETKFGGVGFIKIVYLGVLASHVILSTTIVPMALSAFYFAFQKRFETHKKVTRILHPIWLYVSMTGVIIFLMLRPYYPGD